MRLPRERNDRVMLATGAALLGLATVVGVDVFWPASDGHLGSQAQANVIRSQPARGTVPHAHTITKIVKTDQPTSVVRDPRDLPPPVGKRGPQRVKVDLETTEVTGNLADGTTYRYWTFHDKIPGPFIRVRVRDTVKVRLKNDDNRLMMHNADFPPGNRTGAGGAQGNRNRPPGENPPAF